MTLSRLVRGTGRRLKEKMVRDQGDGCSGARRSTARKQPPMRLPAAHPTRSTSRPSGTRPAGYQTRP
ncbi:conserved domain protein [Actinomyces sp. oral taxon 170 str. F0386]|nr:conserved domain protein [Actinomyces sp. oral taxon 170 str. F0386]